MALGTAELVTTGVPVGDWLVGLGLPGAMHAAVTRQEAAKSRIDRLTSPILRQQTPERVLVEHRHAELLGGGQL